ncbi:MAG: ABC transporter substrate-binding protein [Acidimicrobiales bacterium]
MNRRDRGSGRVWRRWRLSAAAGVACLAGVALVASSCGAGTRGAASGHQGAPGTSTPGNIVVGLANNEGQGISIPAYRYGAMAAVRYMNSHGGINGHKISLDVCIDDGSPEGSVTCANKFVAAHAVVYFAGVDNGADAALPVLSSAGIPYVTEFPWGTAQGTSPNAFNLGAGDAAFFVAPLHSLKLDGAKTVAYFTYNIPTAEELLPVAKILAKQDGLKLDPVTVSATNANWTTAVATAQADGADAMWGVLQESDCTDMVRTARDAGFKGVIAVGSCSAYINALGNQAANTSAVWPYYFPQLASVAPPAIKHQLAVYTVAMRDAGYGKFVNGFATASFASMMELGEVMRGVQTPLTGPALQAALAHAHVPGFMGPPVQCGANVIPAEPSACNAQVLLLKVVKTAHGPIRELQQPGFYNAAG